MIQFLSLISSLCFIGAALPAIVRLVKTKNSKGISLIWALMINIGIISTVWIMLIKNVPFIGILPQVLNELGMVFLTFFIFKYRR